MTTYGKWAATETIPSQPCKRRKLDSTNERPSDLSILEENVVLTSKHCLHTIQGLAAYGLNRANVIFPGFVKELTGEDIDCNGNARMDQHNVWVGGICMSHWSIRASFRDAFVEMISECFGKDSDMLTRIGKMESPKEILDVICTFECVCAYIRAGKADTFKMMSALFYINLICSAEYIDISGDESLLDSNRMVAPAFEFLEYAMEGKSIDGDAINPLHGLKGLGIAARFCAIYMMHSKRAWCKFPSHMLYLWRSMYREDATARSWIYLSECICLMLADNHITPDCAFEEDEVSGKVEYNETLVNLLSEDYRFYTKAVFLHELNKSNEGSSSFSPVQDVATRIMNMMDLKYAMDHGLCFGLQINLFADISLYSTHMCFKQCGPSDKRMWAWNFILMLQHFETCLARIGTTRHRLLVVLWSMALNNNSNDYINDMMYTLLHFDVSGLLRFIHEKEKALPDEYTDIGNVVDLTNSSWEESVARIDIDKPLIRRTYDRNYVIAETQHVYEAFHAFTAYMSGKSRWNMYKYFPFIGKCKDKYQFVTFIECVKSMFGEPLVVN